MKLFTMLILLLIILNSNNAKCLRDKRSTPLPPPPSTQQQQQVNIKTMSLAMAPALMLTTSDTISLIYPKEMGYEKDFLHVIYKLNSPQSQSDHSSASMHNETLSYLRIEDSVYDNQTWSIYCLISNSSGGSELIRLQHLVPVTRRDMIRYPNRKQQPTQTLVNNQNQSLGTGHYQLASNWSRTLVYKNSTAKILSLDINVKKRRIYWFEFNLVDQKWSLAIKKLSSQHQPLYYTFGFYFFSEDGYSFITVAHDTSETDSYNNKLKNDITFFVSNNQTLNICYLVNLTCEDYFRAPPPVELSTTSSTTTSTKFHSHSSDYDEEEYLIETAEDNTVKSTTKTDLNASSSIKLLVNELPPLYRFGRLMGIKYDRAEHALYLADYGNDRIEKITFEAKSFRFQNIETILKSDLSQTPINPIMSVFYDSYIFWIDFEEGLKTTVFKSSCIRTIYKAKEATNLRLIQIGTFKTIKPPAVDGSTFTAEQLAAYYDSSVNVLNRLVSLQDANNQFQYPPDYDNYLSNEEVSFERKQRIKLALKSKASAVRRRFSFFDLLSISSLFLVLFLFEWLNVILVLLLI
jgi:hypothetical protein